jgi:hypothetical protein
MYGSLGLFPDAAVWGDGGKYRDWSRLFTLCNLLFEYYI